MVTNAETFHFQAETTHLLNLVINSLYTTKEIFLRELISNASDALDRLRFEALTRPELMSDDAKLEVRLEVDREERTLTINDTGIGMSRDELIANIGTIARSGTRELRDRLKSDVSDENLLELIGNFGVGFYSAFMVADRVRIVTRRAGEETATWWESTGSGEYTVGDTEKAGRGTSVCLYLKPADPEKGIEDYTDRWTLARVVKRYSDFVAYPIIYQERGEAETQSDAAEETQGTAADAKILNSMRPLWTRPASDVSESEYAEFYKHISHDVNEPLHTLPLRAEGVLEYRALLFIPSVAPYDLYYHAYEPGLRLYAKGVLVVEQCAELLPRYLRFVKGIVDSADLPLNISRQMLQQEQQLRQMRKWLTKKILDALQSLQQNEPDKYLSFWQQFGRAVKEGIGFDFENKDRIVPLLLFASSHDPEKLTTLKEYVERMKEEQQEIFYITGESRSVAENSPHLEAILDKGYEVLFLIDSVDELVVQYLTEFEGKRLKSVGKGTVKLGSEEEREEAEKALKQRETEASELLQFIQQKLDEQIKEVRLTNRLTNSPVCLVGSEHDYSPQLERLLEMGKSGRPRQRRIMELNPQHEIFTRMDESFRANRNDEVLGDYAELLLGYALLAEGSPLPDVVRFNRLLAKLMSQTLSGMSSSARS